MMDYEPSVRLTPDAFRILMDEIARAASDELLRKWCTNAAGTLERYADESEKRPSLPEDELMRRGAEIERRARSGEARRVARLLNDLGRERDK